MTIWREFNTNGLLSTYKDKTMTKSTVNNVEVTETTPELTSRPFTTLFRKKDKSLPPNPDKPEKRGKPGAVAGARKLTLNQKAEVAALYHSGSYSVADLAKRFGKHCSTITNILKTMGVKKGGGFEDAAKKIVEKMEERALTDREVMMQKIVKAKEEYYLMNSALAKMVWNEIKQEKGKEDSDLGRLKDSMTALKIASDLIGNSRKEVFTILNVERFDKERTNDELPELTVRELTNKEIAQLQYQAPDDEIGT